MSDLAIDHVVFCVDDLNEAGHEMEKLTGMAAVPGGEHEGRGTSNAIVPLGDAYLELLTVSDPDLAACNQWGRWAMDHLGSDLRPHAWCLRTSDLDGLAAGIGRPAEPMSRMRPDGVKLSWKLAGLDAATSPEALPFFIEWQVKGDEMPGVLEPGQSPATIEWIETGSNGLEALLGPHRLPLRFVKGSGIRQIAIKSDLGEAVF